MKIKKIKKNREFTSIYNNSKKIYTKYTIIFMKENKNNERKFGFVASKKTGNAVQRNRIKRLLREFVRLNENKFENNMDYIFIGKSILKESIFNLSYSNIEKDLVRGLKLIKK